MLHGVFYSDKETDEQGNSLEVIDAMQSELHEAAAKRLLMTWHFIANKLIWRF
ncbi:hypothetical protein ACOBV8_21295 (plasmid) [Pseudoalteromonas espejiana]